MPESYEGENFCRAERLVRGPSNEATQEHINIAIFKLSNKLDTKLSWSQRLQVFETSGIMSTRAQLNQHSESLRTISALAEVFYQDALEFLYGSRSDEAPDYLQPRSARLVCWLLSLGYPSDTYIMPDPWYDGDTKVTGLQIAMCCENYELACALLDARANPNLWSHDIPPSQDNELLRLPPLSIAVCCRNSSGRNAMIRRLLAAGADIRAEQERDDGFLVKDSTLSTIVACEFPEQEEAEVQEIMDILGVAQASFVTADVLIAAALNGNMKNLELLLQINPDVNMANSLGLTALHAAAFRGDADICSVLIQRGCYIDHPDQLAPSPLHLAAFRDHVDIVAMLFQHGASLIRGITITEYNYEAMSSRYFWGVFHDHNNHSSFPMKDWMKVKELASGLESPVGAAVYGTYGESEGTVAYMVQHGASLPTSTVWLASSRPLTRLLSLALRQNLNPDRRGPDDCTPLQRSLCDSLWDRKTSNCVQTVSKLLDAGAMVVGGEAILAVRKLGSWDIVERILSSDHDGLAERYDLIPHWQNLSVSIGTTLLETAILGESEVLIGHVLARNPDEYSAGALCAASLQAAEEGNTLALLERLLQNRANLSSTHEEDLVCETTAVGIAAWKGDSAMIKLLHAYIPISDLAYLPTTYRSVKLGSTVPDPSRIPGSRPLYFWHNFGLKDEFDNLLMGSPVNFALDKPKILDQLLRYGYNLDRISLVMVADSGDTSTLRSLVQGRDILHNEYASERHSPLYHAITNGDLEMSTLLLELGEDINDNEYNIRSGRSPLASAVENNNLPLIEMLLKAGADVNGPPARFRGMTALQCAVAEKALESVKQLIDLGAEVNAPPAEIEGMTALQCAAAQGSLGIAKQLIDRGADINAGRGERYGRTALEAAAEYGRIDMVQLILSEGVETTGNGRHQYVGAIARAKIAGHYVTARMLREHRPWTDEDQLLWESEDLLESDVGDWVPGAEVWEEKDDEEFGMTSAGEGEADSSQVHFASHDYETLEEEDGMDLDSNESTIWKAPSAIAPNVMNQDVVADTGFAIEVDGDDVDAIDWDAFLTAGPAFINEDMSTEPWVVWDRMAGIL